MANVTVKIDDAIVKTARKIAIDRKTTLASLIRTYVETLAGCEDDERRRAVRELEEIWASSEAEVGDRTWTRDELHER